MNAYNKHIQYEINQQIKFKLLCILYDTVCFLFQNRTHLY